MFTVTKRELDSILKNRLHELIGHAGGATHLSKMIPETKPSTIQGWVQRGRISVAGATRVESNKKLAIKFTKEYLRPDYDFTKLKNK